MPDNTLPDLQDLVNEFNKLRSRLVERLSTLKPADIQSLSGMLLENYNSVQALPETIACVYFLTHPEQGLLYIGKSKDLRKRFAIKYQVIYNVVIDEQFTHSRLLQALELGNVRLSWLEVPHEINEMLESILIKELAPKWNGRSYKSTSPKVDVEVLRELKERWGENAISHLSRFFPLLK